MMSRPLIREILPLLLMTVSWTASASGFNCRDVKMEGEALKASASQTLCFLRDDTYFISERCASLNCKFIQKLKSHRPRLNQNERPGATTCKALGGIQETVVLPPAKLQIQRCLFTEDRTSISLNLLESWNGKHFSGPSKPLDL